jgi:MSHA biogenesis protein MshP
MIRGAQRGMSLVVAIFLIVIIALLAAFAVSVGSAASASTNLQLHGDRALAAARAGIEWGAYRALVQNACVANPPPINLNQAALRGYRVTVTCARTTRSDGFFTFEITAIAQHGNFGAQDYAWRRLIGRYSNAP